MSLDKALELTGHISNKRVVCAMSMTKAVRREGCKDVFSRCLVALALAAVAGGSAAAGRIALVIGNAAHREAWLSKTGSVSHDGFAQKSSFTTKLYEHIMEPVPKPAPKIDVALGRAGDEVMRVAADRHEFFVYSSPTGSTIAFVPPADPTDGASARRPSMEVEMKTGHRKFNKKDKQLDSPAGAHRAIMFPKKTDEDLQNVELKPAKVHRAPTRPIPKTEPDNP